MTTAFDPLELGAVRLANRIVMAPMTRSRAFGPGATPTDSVATYYAQRASAGLIITEGTHPSAVGQGYPDTPGLHSAAQVAAWRKVTDAVHGAGGRIFVQLMHTGRIGHPSLLPDGLVPVGASAVPAAGQVYTHEGPKDFVTPHVLTEDEIRATVADFVSAARNAIDAGFDGVELHGANG
ncbi:alkene reductase, partial [Streptomyces sp. NPDC057654]